MNYATTSDSLAVGSTVVQAQPCALTSVMLVGGSAASTAIIYDSATTSIVGAKIVASLACPASGFASLPLDVPVICNKGMLVIVAGTAATAVAHYVLSA